MNDVTPAAASRAVRDKRIFELRTLGWTHQAIADEIGCSRSTVTLALNPVLKERERARRQVNSERIGIQQREYRRRNAERIRERVREYSRANVGRKAEYDRQYREANSVRIAAYQADYREKNASRISERNLRYRRANRQQILERRRARWAAQATELNAQRRARYDDSIRERVGRYRLAHLAEHRAAHGRRKMRAFRGMDALDRLLSAEYRRAIYREPCVYCGASSEHDDHKFPLARGGTDHWWNLQRTCQDCNFRKHTMTHEEFLASGKIPNAA